MSLFDQRVTCWADLGLKFPPRGVGVPSEVWYSGNDHCNCLRAHCYLTGLTLCFLSGRIRLGAGGKRVLSSLGIQLGSGKQRLPPAVVEGSVQIHWGSCLAQIEENDEWGS